MGDRPALASLHRNTQAPPPLAGVRVVDFTRVMAGPFGTQMLGDLGAEVIKIENPGVGDDTRSLRRAEASVGGEATFYLAMNRSKRSVAIDLKSPEGRQVALDLIATADILVENFSGAVMRKFQLDYPSLRERFPSLIYCSVSGYGRSGSNVDTAGYDTAVSADAGVFGLNAWAGGSPVQVGLPYTDISTALNSVIGILAALHARARDGKGQHVDVAMFDTALANLSFRGMEFLGTGAEAPLYDPQMPMPVGLYDTAEGRIFITCGHDKMFRALCTAVLERPDLAEDPRFSTAPVRFANGEAFLAELRRVLATRTSQDWSERCKRAGVPCGVVRTPGQALTSPEATERQSVFGLPHPTAGLSPAIAQPFRFSETPCQYTAPPLLGQHTREVLQGLFGYDDERMASLAASGAIEMLATEDNP